MTSKVSFISLVQVFAAVCLAGSLSASALAAPLVGAQGKTNSRSPLSCSSAVYDFGTLDNEETIEHLFVLRNEGTNAIWLDKVLGCCGATSELSSSTVLPGCDVSLKIRISLKGRSGEQTMSFYVRPNNSAWPLYELRIKGVALAKVDVQPSAVMLGAFAEDAAAEKLVSIVCQSNIVFNITNIVCSSQYIGATYLGISGNVHRVSIRTVPPLPFGITRDTVRVLTDDKKYQVLEIPVLARVTKDIVVFPGEIRLARSGGGPAVGSWFGVVRSISRIPFRIVGTEVPAPEIEVVCSPMANGGYKVEIRNLSPQIDFDGKQIILKTDDVRAHDVVIPIRLFNPDDIRP